MTHDERLIVYTVTNTPFTLNADRLTYHRERAVWCFFRAWQYYLNDALELSIAFEKDMLTHLGRVFYEQQRLKRGGIA